MLPDPLHASGDVLVRSGYRGTEQEEQGDAKASYRLLHSGFSGRAVIDWKPLVVNFDQI
jgi:hypothetical protein